MKQISESIFDGATTIIPMADVHYIEKHWYPSDERTRDNYRGIKIITKHTIYNIGADIWDNNIYLDRKEGDEFLKAWCCTTYIKNQKDERRIPRIRKVHSRRA